MNIQEQEEHEFTITTKAEWDREDAREKGTHRKDQQWILSDRDVWYKNPSYRGPDQPHPEEPSPEDVEPIILHPEQPEPTK